jgi:hypothetical protein
MQTYFLGAIVRGSKYQPRYPLPEAEWVWYLSISMYIPPNKYTQGNNRKFGKLKVPSSEFQPMLFASLVTALSKTVLLEYITWNEAS